MTGRRRSEGKASPLVAVSVPQLGDHRGKHWAKLVTDVDTAKASGWAFLGDFVADGGIQDLPAEGVLLVYGERGSRANPRPEAQIFRVNSDGTLSLEAEARGRAWARTLRDRAAELVAALKDGQDSMRIVSEVDEALHRISDGELAAELRRRGWSVTAPD